MAPDETAALQTVDVGAIKALSETEAGAGATPLEDVEDAFLLVSAYVAPTTWNSSDGGTRDGSVTRMLAALTPSDVRNARFTEIYSNSDAIALQISALLEKDQLGPTKPVMVKFMQGTTRSGYRVHKLISPTENEFKTFMSKIKEVK